MSNLFLHDDPAVRALISDVEMNYGRGIDLRDWDLYRSIFTDEIEVDFSSWSGLVQAMQADDWVARVRGNLSGFDATQHLISNLQFESDASGIWLMAQMVAIHALREDGGMCFQSIGGHYRNHFCHVDGQWRIDQCTLTVRWEKGDRKLFDIARRRLEKAKDGVLQ